MTSSLQAQSPVNAEILQNKRRVQMEENFNDEPTHSKDTEQPRLSPQIEGERLAEIGEHAATLTQR
jgi:hypothetical protein